MPVTPSPLRYPGGKTAIAPMVETILCSNGLKKAHYAEPYAGGAGLALSLLYKGAVSHIHLNDYDRSVWAVWYSILNHTEDFVELINSTEITIEEWHHQRSVQENKNKTDPLTLGFSSFFLNRTNRSGIIEKAGVIGGLQQKSKYPLSCRFNKNNLIEKIRKIASFKENIHLYNLDALDFIDEIEALDEKIFYFIDPPYFVKGQSLYTNFYEPSDHKDLADRIRSINGKWILTYDYSDFIRSLYSDFRQFRFSLNYSAAEKRKGTELLVVNKGLKLIKKLELEKAA
ncbi:MULTISPECIES: DNA adenine methylase [unclassified Vibrio]|uniref:DNA adenine methylase n=1 Tax=unclassified Vibrio TaxID=2614977 RepID=UPI0014833C75|nr:MULTISPECIES: DNA adenine methylase [unclassified Vibrio]MDQ2190605.1 DNA adenine methylase [Vibrio sp. A14(2019)]MDQ2196813.1 DNA adenine methylase [Vibrio sp. 2017_1457_11]NNN75344.1 DNA adenine methylase [Vibrio sp. B7]NNN92081.1 DNA adenine methylase [Vibrio sp. B8-1]NNO07381.1 DNA adenine methylase [Vibrio sp. B4-12]